MQAWRIDAMLPTLFFLPEAVIFSKQAWDTAALGTARMHTEQFLSRPRSHLSHPVVQRCWVRIPPMKCHCLS